MILHTARDRSSAVAGQNVCEKDLNCELYGEFFYLIVLALPTDTVCYVDVGNS